MGPAGQQGPPVSETETEPAALLDGRGQNSTAASSPAVTSSHDDLLDYAHRLIYMAGPIVDSGADGGDHGGTVELDHGGTPMWATVARADAAPSITELRRSYRVP